MSQFSGAKNPPWARPQSEFISVSVATTMAAANSLTQQAQVANTMMPGNPTVFSLGNSTPAAPQYTAQQVAALGLQAQQVAAAAAMSSHSATANNPVIPQPGIATPTSLATTQVATVSYPTPRAAQPQIGPKQRVFTGTITKLHDNFGFVDEDVFFQTSCVKGTIPKTGDRVLVEATYNANMPFKWNATRIQVLPGQGTPAGPVGFGNINKAGGMSSMTSMIPVSGISSSGPGINPSPSLPQSLMNPAQQGGRGPLNTARRNDPPRFERNRDRKRDIMQDKRDRPDRVINRKRSRSRSPVKRSDPPHQRSPARRRPRIVPRYVVQVPKLSFDMQYSNVVTMKSRYTNMYIPSDFFNANFTWAQAFPIKRPFQLGNSCSFHLMHKDVESLSGNVGVLDPPDTDHRYSAKVMLLSCPTTEELYHKSCALAEDTQEVQDAFVHPTRLIHFLVGLKGKNETMAIGGPWSPSLDGPNPEEDPRVLIKTAIRTTKALTGVDLSICTQWYRFAEVQYLRPEETHKGKHVQAHVETTVIFLPDVWSCNPTRLEWGTLHASYKKQLQRKLAAVEGSKDENSQEEGEGESDQPAEPTHFSELDPKTMKIIDLRKELESRTLSSKGLKSQLIARLTKAIKTEQEKEEEKDQQETEEEVPEEVKKNLEAEEKDEQKKKEMEEEKKKKEERERASLERKYKLPESPAIIVHPHPTAKNGKFDCSIMSLSVLLDYRPEDNKEHSFEVSLFAELFNEMLMRDFGFEIFKSLVKAPEKKEEDKKDKEKDKDKKTSDDKSLKEPSNKKKKMDEKEKKDKDKDSERKAYKVSADEAKDKKKDDEKKSDDRGDDEKEEDEDDEDSEDKSKKDKKKEKKKYITKEPSLLLAFTYFDQNHCGYLLDKDVEEIVHTIGLHLSRAQVKKLVQKVISRDALNYRKMTDKAITGEKEEEVADMVTETDWDKILAGNKDYLSKQMKISVAEKSPEKEVKQELCGFVNYKGSMLDIESVMQRLEKSEKTRTEMEKQMQEFIRDKEKMTKAIDSKDESSQKLTAELKTLKQKLLVQEKITNNSEATSKKYLSALMESKEHLMTMMTTVTAALGDTQEEDEVEVKKEMDTNGAL